MHLLVKLQVVAASTLVSTLVVPVELYSSLVEVVVASALVQRMLHLRQHHLQAQLPLSPLLSLHILARIFLS